MCVCVCVCVYVCMYVCMYCCLYCFYYDCFLDKYILDNSELLLHLKKKVGKDWLDLGRFLLVSNNELDVIDADYDGLEEKTYRMLCLWKNQQKFPTLNALANAIYKINRIDLIRVMEKFSSKNFFF